MDKYYYCNLCNNCINEHDYTICNKCVTYEICDNCIDDYKCYCELDQVEKEFIAHLKKKMTIIKDQVKFTYLKESE